MTLYERIRYLTLKQLKPYQPLATPTQLDKYRALPPDTTEPRIDYLKRLTTNEDQQEHSNNKS